MMNSMSANLPDVQKPLYEQIADKFEDANYLNHTRVEMGSPYCMRKPMYVVGKGSQIPDHLRKVGSIVITLLGTVTVIPAIYWTFKAAGEFICMPVSSRIFRSIFMATRDQAISPAKQPLEKVVATIKYLAKAILVTAIAYALGHVYLGLIGVGIYTILKHAMAKAIASVIRTTYTNNIDKGPKHLRMSVMVDGDRIDTFIVMGNKKIEPGQRWILATNGNGVPAETVVTDVIGKKKTMLTQLQSDLGANVITFNYGGCLGSEGNISAQKAAKIYQAMKAMLEDQKGLAAKEIIFYGHSIGGAIQAKGLKGCDFKKEIKYVCVKDRTFSNTEDQLERMFPSPLNKGLKFLIKYLGWNINVKEQCDELYAKKISQVIINNHWDPVIQDPLRSRFLSETLDKNLFYMQETQSYGGNNNPHMDAPIENEKCAIIDQVKGFLA